MYRLTFIRIQHRLSKCELGRKANIQYSTISALEHGKIFPFAGWRKRLGAALQTEPDRLFDEVDESGQIIKMFSDSKIS